MIAKVLPPFPDVDFNPDYKSVNSSLWDVNWTDVYIAATPQMKDTILDVSTFEEVLIADNHFFHRLLYMQGRKIEKLQRR